jgi:hypothetical protein
MKPQPPVRNRFFPSVDVLEDRSFLSVTLSFTAPGALAVRAANDQGHVVSILDNNGTVTVTADGVAYGPIAGITSINYQGGNRGDLVLYVLERSGSAGPITGRHDLVVNQKSGHDVFTGVVAGNLGNAGGSQRALVDLRVNGAGGDTANLLDAGSIRARSSLVYTASAQTQTDELFGGTIAGFVGLNLDGSQNGGRGANVNVAVSDPVGRGGVLLLDVGNGNGRNTDNVSFTGQVTGFLEVAVSGGSNRDVLTTNLTLAAGSTGRVVAQESGVHNHLGDGTDTLTLGVRQAAGDTPALTALLDGGGSTGNCFNTANVFAFDFRTDTIIA